MSFSGYPNFSLINSIFADCLLSVESKLLTYFESSDKKLFRDADDVRVGWAAIIQEGHGVGTDPIY